MIKSKTKIEAQLKKKTGAILVNTVIEAKKNPGWIEVAGILTTPGRKLKGINLSDVEKAEGAIIIVTGKLLSGGDITKKVKVAALGFSEKAKEKLLKAGCEVTTIAEEIKANKEGKGITILRK